VSSLTPSTEEKFHLSKLYWLYSDEAERRLFLFIPSSKHSEILSSSSETSASIGKGAARGGAEGAQAPPLAIRILMFIS